MHYGSFHFGHDKRFRASFLQQASPALTIGNEHGDLTIYCSLDQLEELYGTIGQHLRVHHAAPTAKACEPDRRELIQRRMPSRERIQQVIDKSRPPAMACPACGEAMVLMHGDHPCWRCFQCGNAVPVASEAATGSEERPFPGEGDISITQSKYKPGKYIVWLRDDSVLSYANGEPQYFDSRKDATEAARDLIDAEPRASVKVVEALPPGWSEEEGAMLRGPEGLWIGYSSVWADHRWVLSFHGPIVIKGEDRRHPSRQAALDAAQRYLDEYRAKERQPLPPDATDAEIGDELMEIWDDFVHDMREDDERRHGTAIDDDVSVDPDDLFISAMASSFEIDRPRCPDSGYECSEEQLEASARRQTPGDVP